MNPHVANHDKTTYSQYNIFWNKVKHLHILSPCEPRKLLPGQPTHDEKYDQTQVVP